MVVINYKAISIKYYVFFLLGSVFFGCHHDPYDGISLDEFILDEGLRIDLIAAEPLLDSPLDISFDAQGRIWAVELPGYMRDIDGSDEEAPDGRLVVLSDNDADGIMDTRDVLLDTLVAPRTLLHVYGGLLYSHGTGLYWSEIEGLSLTNTILIDSLYVVGGNIEHQPNNLYYHQDNWIYSANSKARYRRVNGEWLREATSFRGQWGLSGDADGYLYYNNNSVPLFTDYAWPNELLDNPYQSIRYNLNQSIAESRRIYPYGPTAVNRGYIEGILDEQGRVKEFTSACGPLIYHGDRLGTAYTNNAFVSAPEGNLIKRYIIEESKDLKIASSPYDTIEFLRSMDETFRPINLYNAPDGSLYILDLRKGIIQHRAYMTSYLRDKILGKSLDQIKGLGRIYRVSQSNDTPKPLANKSGYTKSDLLKLLQSNLMYNRIYAQRVLIGLDDRSIKDELVKILLNPKNEHGQISALWTLEGLGLIDADIWQQASQMPLNTKIHWHVAKITSRVKDVEVDSLISYFQKLTALGNRSIDQQIAREIGKYDIAPAQSILTNLIDRYGNDPHTVEYLINGLSGKEESILTQVKNNSSADSLSNMLNVVINYKVNEDVKTPQLPKATYKDKRTAGLELYSQYCSACHGLDGMGKNQLAPPLVHSEYVSGSPERLTAITLVGLQGPITVNGKNYDMKAVMPGIMNNPALTDADISDLLTFLRNSFSESSWVSEEIVSKTREELMGRTEPFRAEELIRFGSEK